MKISQEQILTILSLAESNPNEALKYMKDNNISPDSEADLPLPGAKSPLIISLIGSKSYELAKILISNNPELVRERFSLPEIPPLMPFPVSGGVLSILFGKRPLNHDMLTFLLSQGCSAKEEIINYWGNIELWQQVALAGMPDELLLLLESNVTIDVNRKIDGMSLFDIFQPRSEKVLTWLNQLNAKSEKMKENTLPVLNTIFAFTSLMHPDENLNMQVSTTMSSEEIVSVFQEFKNKMVALAEKAKADKIIPDESLLVLNHLLAQMEDLETTIELSLVQEKLIHQQLTPGLEKCLDLLRMYRANQTNSFASSGLLGSSVSNSLPFVENSQEENDYIGLASIGIR